MAHWHEFVNPDDVQSAEGDDARETRDPIV